MPRPIGVLVMLTVLLAGCSAVDESSPSAGIRSSTPSRSAAVASPSSGQRRPLPEGFPVLPGAVAVAMPPNDQGLIGLWESERPGSAAYDFYATALPVAGYPIIGLYPGGEVALIRFRAPDGEVWQMVAYAAADGRVAIEIRLDRP